MQRGDTNTRSGATRRRSTWCRLRWSLGLIGGLWSACWATAALAQPAARVVSLEEAVSLAVQNSPQIKEEQFGVLKRQSQRAQANAARFAQVEITIVGGPSPRARGNHLNSPDSKTDPDITGVFGLGTFSVIQPLYTFGKIDSLREAAAHGIAVSEAQVQQKATEVALLVHEAYYGHLLALALENLALEIADQLNGTLSKVQRQLDAGAPGVDNVDLLKLQTFQGELEKQLNDIRQGKALALVGLRTLMGLEPGAPLMLADKALEPRQQQTPPVEQYVNDARQLRPEFTQAREGVKALEKLVDAAKADYYPVVFMGVFGSLGEATNRDLVKNPFITDRLKDDVVAPVLGVQWKFNLGITAGKVDEAEAELGKVQQKKALAEQGVPFQVQKAYLELQQHQGNIEATRKGYRSGRQWLVTAASNFDLGVGPGKDVADAAVAYAKLRAEYLQSVYRYNLGLVKLDHAAGRDVAAVKPLLPALPGK
ncbi:MAG: TolC family protein [Candidatus Tectimicrobiota bacterium]